MRDLKEAVDHAATSSKKVLALSWPPLEQASLQSGEAVPNHLDAKISQDTLWSSTSSIIGVIGINAKGYRLVRHE